MSSLGLRAVLYCLTLDVLLAMNMWNEDKVMMTHSKERP